MSTTPIRRRFTHPIIILTVLITLTFFPSPTTPIPQFPQIPYSLYCNDVVSQKPVVDKTYPFDYTFLRLSKAVFSPQNSSNSNPDFQNPDFKIRNFAVFSVKKAYETELASTLNVVGVLRLQGNGVEKYFGKTARRGLRNFHVRKPRIGVGRRDAVFKIFGFWDKGTGKLCMVGSGVSALRDVNVVFKFLYPNSSNVVTSLVSGKLESIENVGSGLYFKPVEILGVSEMGYGYEYVGREIGSGGFGVYDDVRNESLSVPDGGRSACLMISSSRRFVLEYGSGCDEGSCGFLDLGGKGVPRFVFFRQVECADNGNVRFLLEFSNSSRDGFQFTLDPATTLVSEGAWDQQKKRLLFVACHLLDNKVSASENLVGNCTIRLSLRLPSTLSLRNRSTIVGKIWNRGRLGTVSFRGPRNMNSWGFEGLKYVYTEKENVTKFCSKNLKGTGNRGRYPDAVSHEMRFDLMVKDKKGHIAWGYSSPLSVNDKFYNLIDRFSGFHSSSSQVNDIVSRETNISYVINFNLPLAFEFGGKASKLKTRGISAEGTYNSDAGIVCMIGCRHLENESVDCGVLVNFHFPSQTDKDGHIEGTIESTRSKADPLYFDRLDFVSSSISTIQAKETIWRLDLELTMVLISKTLACIFVVMQLLYVRKNPEAIPFISVLMLTVLTLAHMIPLLLNFEAMFLENKKQNVLLGRDEWLEVNEVFVRIITMVAFLLQLRLLQLTWSARNGNETRKKLWIADKKVIYLSLPLYIGGSLIAWFTRKSYLKTHGRNLLVMSSHQVHPQLSFWGELKSYAGLILDGFLIPQILFNLFSDSKERALAPSFYVGGTVVRLLPHLYDLYRAHSSPWFYYKVYANPRMDYYSTAWDVIISCCGLLWMFLIFLQQRFGGRCFLPKRFRGADVYEKVPVDGT